MSGKKGDIRRSLNGVAMTERRKFLGTLMGGAIVGLSSSVWAEAPDSRSALPANRASRRPASGHRGAWQRSIETGLAHIERSVGGRLGVAILDSQSGLIAGRRMDERFPMCSTFKLLAASAILERVDRREENLDRKIVISLDEVLNYAPVTRTRVGGTGMSLDEVCKAAITLSDNTAANIMLASLGGPAALTAFARQLGDTVTRLDRNEPTLNEEVPGDPRDTTSPAAMVADMHAILLGDVLSSASRAQLLAWLVANQTGGARIRAGLPSDWRIGDKTGSGERSATNDVAILFPPERSPILVTAYLVESNVPVAKREAALAQVGRLVASNIV
ncbi:MAG TPA: class A beta-lactamase [Trinickia sp.]|nr:class A beta-lactamase [Trinickia sp.]